MRRWLRALMTSTAVVATPCLMELAPARAQLSFANCRAWHRHDGHGVARSFRAAERQLLDGHGMPADGRRAHNAYVANHRALDLDHHGTVCEA